MSLIDKFECGDVVENRYHLDIKIHEGRWGDIYRGTDRLNDKPVAIRFFPITDTGPDDYERFEAHARELSGLTAPGIVTPADHGMDDEIPYLVYHWAHGQNLQDRLAERGPLELERTVEVLEQLLKGLDRAHDSRMTHGLIRPVKVIVDDLDGDKPLVKIVDFQIWRFYEWSRGEKAFDESNLSRRIVRYTSPEVLDDHRVKPSTDVYATGLLAIELLSGQPAFDDNNRVALIARQMGEETAELDQEVDAGESLRAFISRLVAKDEKDRFRTATKALAALQEQKQTFLTEPRSTKDSSEPQNDSKPPTPDESSPPEPSGDTAQQGAEKDESAQKTDGSPTQKPPADKPPSNAESSTPDVDPDEELFEGDPAAMQSLSDGESMADNEDLMADSESTADDESMADDEDLMADDDLFADEGDFGDYYQDDQSVSSPDNSSDTDSDNSANRHSPDSTSRSKESLDSAGHASDDDQDFDDSIASDIPRARGEEKIIADKSPDLNRDDRRPGPPSRRGAAPGDNSDISLPVAAAILLAMLAVIAGATYMLVFSGEDPDHQVGEFVEAEEEVELFLLRVNTDPPGQNVLVVGNGDGISPMEIEVSEQDFPLEVRARKDSENEKHRIIENPTDEIWFEFED